MAYGATNWGPTTYRASDPGASHVLLLSADELLRQRTKEKLRSPRWEITEVTSGAGALELLHESDWSILLADSMLPDLDFYEFSAMVVERFPAVQVLTLNSQTGHLTLGSTSPTALSEHLVEIFHGASSAPPPAALSELQVSRMRVNSEATPGLRGVIGSSLPMRQVYELTHMVARRETSVLITGESGTGKDLIARAIHFISPRRKQPLVTINCAAIPEALLEAELFGYVKGSFTGAAQSRMGRIHAAHGGTLFLDEIGDMPLSLQSKILRFLEEGEVQRIGANDNLRVDVRVVAATNAPLRELIQQKLFREDLYYRLAIFPIKLPPLRDRLGDVEKLAIAFAERFCPGVTLGRAALDMLERHSWPGNVRELRNVLERCSILVGDGGEILAEHVIL